MANEQVGGISYSVSLDTKELINGQRQVERSLDQMNGRFRDSAGRLREANGQFVKVGESASRASRDVSGFSSSLEGIGGGFQLAAIAASVMMIGDALRQAQISAEKLSNTLFFANNGDLGAVSADLDYLRSTANRLGLDFESSAQNFAKFKAAAQTSGTSAEQVRTIFEGVSQATTAMGLSAAESERAYTALTQMMSKGQVMAEEWKGQLSEAIPIATGVMTKALGVTTQEFNKMMEAGEVNMEMLAKFAIQLKEDTADAAEKAADGMQAATNRMGNAWLELKKTVAESGLGDLIKWTMDKATESMNTYTRAIKEAKAEGAGFFGQAFAVYKQGWKDFTVQGQIVSALRGGDDGKGARASGKIINKEAEAAKQEKARLDADAKRRLDAQANFNSKYKSNAAKKNEEILALNKAADAAGLRNSAAYHEALAKIEEKYKPKGAGRGRAGKTDAEKEAEKAAKQELADAKWLFDEKQRMAKDEERAMQSARQADEKTAEQGRKLAESLADTQKSPALLAAEEWGARLEAIQMYEDTELRMAEDNEEKKLEIRNAYNLARYNADLDYHKKTSDLAKARAAEERDLMYSQLGQISGFLGEMGNLMGNFSNNRDAENKKSFNMQKAFGIAQATTSMYIGIAKGLEAGGWLGYAQAAMAAAAGANAIAGIKSANYGGGRQYGGTVSAGSLYRVNETGQPEMFTAANGKQYMMPTANGNVTPANQVGGGGGVSIIVNNNVSGADVQATASPDGRMIEIAVNRAVTEVASQFATNSGKVWQAAKGSTNIQGKTA